MREFGRPVPGVTYRDRPGAYAVMLDTIGRVAVIRTQRGCFLPGGGIDPGESAEEALRREVREECGCAVRIMRSLGEAAQYVYAKGEPFGLRKVGAYFEGAIDGEPGEIIEPDHELLWLEPAVAAGALRHEAQSWAVRFATTPTEDE